VEEEAGLVPAVVKISKEEEKRKLEHQSTENRIAKQYIILFLQKLFILIVLSLESVHARKRKKILR
jgi:hypothetical protein